MGCCEFETTPQRASGRTSRQGSLNPNKTILQNDASGMNFPGQAGPQQRAVAAGIVQNAVTFPKKCLEKDTLGAQACLCLCWVIPALL